MGSRLLENQKLGNAVGEGSLADVGLLRDYPRAIEKAVSRKLRKEHSISKPWTKDTSSPRLLHKEGLQEGNGSWGIDAQQVDSS